MATEKTSCIKPIRVIIAVILSLCAAIAFSTKVSVSNFSLHDNITLADNTLLWSLFVIALTICHLRVFSRAGNLRDSVSVGIFALLFGFGNVIGHSLYYLDSWDFLFGNTYQLLIGSVSAIGYAGVFYAAGIALFGLLDKQSVKSQPITGRTGLFKLLDEHPRLVCSIIIGFVLLIWLVIYFPGYTNNDLNYQLRQFYGIEPMTNSHPVLSTMIMGCCMNLGKLLGNDCFGLFAYMLLQAAVFVIAFGAVCDLAKKIGAGMGFRIVLLLFYTLLPVWGAYSVQGMKDGLFAGMFTLFAATCIDMYLRANEGDPLSRLHFVGLTSIAILTCLLRSAVSFIIIPSLFLLAFAMRNRQALRGMLVSTIVSGVCAFGFIYLLLPAMGVIKCNKTESLSIPFQQVARIVRDHGNELTSEEKQTINEVLDYDSLPEIYMPVLSDPVKDTYKQRELPTEASAVAAFKRVWLGLLRRYPSTAIQATVANTFGYFSFTPSIHTSNGHTGMCFFLSDDKNDGHITTDTYSISYPKVLKPIRKPVLAAAYLVDAVPGINMLYACAFYFWMIILMTVYIIHRGGFRLIGLSTACLLLQIGCLGSSVNDCFRYEAPLAAALPVLLIAALYVGAKNALHLRKDAVD